MASSPRAGQNELASALLTPEPYKSRVGKLCTTMLNFDHLVRNGINALKSDIDTSGRSQLALLRTNRPQTQMVSAAQLAEKLFDDVGEQFNGTYDWGRHTQMSSSPRYSHRKAQEFLQVLETDKKSLFEQHLSPTGGNHDYDDGSIQSPRKQAMRKRKYFKARPKTVISPRGLMASGPERFQAKQSDTPAPGQYKPRFAVVEKEPKGCVKMEVPAPTKSRKQNKEEPNMPLPSTSHTTAPLTQSQPVSGNGPMKATKAPLPSIPFRQKIGGSRLGPRQDLSATTFGFHWPRQEPQSVVPHQLLSGLE